MKSCDYNNTLELRKAVHSFVRKSPDPFSTLAQLLRDFPKYAEGLAKLSDSFTKGEIPNLSQYSGTNEIWLNGVELDVARTDAFRFLMSHFSNLTSSSLLDGIYKEFELISKLKQLGLSSDDSLSLLKLPVLHESSGEAEFDQIDRYDVRGKNILWWNDVEKDRRYKSLFQDLDMVPYCFVFPPGFTCLGVARAISGSDSANKKKFIQSRVRPRFFEYGTLDDSSRIL